MDTEIVTLLVHTVRSVLLLRVKYAVLLLLTLLFLTLCMMLVRDHQDSQHCYMDHTQDGKRVCLTSCPQNQFILPGMHACHKMLTCREIKSGQLVVKESIETRAVKAVFLASWNGHDVVVNTLAQPLYSEDFFHGLNMLKSSQESIHVTKLLGYCDDMFLTEYHTLGDASKLPGLLTQVQFQHLDSLSLRVGLCVEYAEIIAYFHSHHTGKRVFCDSNTLNHTLQQFLITSSLHLAANDLDALPLVEPGGAIHCGHRPIYGEFVAPEQRWPNPKLPYNEDLLPGYNEKVDIWKIPDVCEHFLGSGMETIKFHLFKLHAMCKSAIAGQRPNASFIVSEYRRIHKEVGLS